MSVIVDGKVIRMTGKASVADAEPLLSALLEDPTRNVDLGAATHLHSSVIQILFAIRPAIAGTPAHPFFNDHILRLLDPEKGSP